MGRPGVKHIDRLSPDESRRRKLLSQRKYQKIHYQEKLDWGLQLKLDAIKAYGERCLCCGETWPVFLAIDHIEGGGSKHREEIGRGGTSFFGWLKRNQYPSGYQVLCHNCNWAKHVKKICPHQTTNGREPCLP